MEAKDMFKVWKSTKIFDKNFHQGIKLTQKCALISKQLKKLQKIVLKRKQQKSEGNLQFSYFDHDHENSWVIHFLG
jgi:hypothetical protein